MMPRSLVAPTWGAGGLLVYNGLSMLGDGFQYFGLSFLDLPKFSSNMDPRTPYLLPKYFRKLEFPLFFYLLYIPEFWISTF